MIEILRFLHLSDDLWQRLDAREWYFEHHPRFLDVCVDCGAIINAGGEVSMISCPRVFCRNIQQRFRMIYDRRKRYLLAYYTDHDPLPPNFFLSEDEVKTNGVVAFSWLIVRT